MMSQNIQCNLVKGGVLVLLDGAAQEASASIDSSLAEGCIREQGAEENNCSIQRNQPVADFTLGFLKIAVKTTEAKRKMRTGVISPILSQNQTSGNLLQTKPGQQVLGSWNTSGIWSTAWAGALCCVGRTCLVPSRGLGE